jgi:biopolymer transport protein TolR
MAMGSLPSGRNRHRRAPMAEINVTPLVDVMLVLLIIFMVTAPLLVAGVPVNLPDTRAKALDQGEKPVQISLDGKGGVFVGEEETTLADLPERLLGIAANVPAGQEQPQIYLRADRRLDYGAVMKVMGELNRAGLNRVALVTTSGTDEAE